MDRTDLQKVLDAAALECGCSVAALAFDEDDNVIDVTITKGDGAVSLGDCEHVHRAVLAAFDRDVEDYALTVGSAGISGAEADALLREMEDKD